MPRQISRTIVEKLAKPFVVETHELNYRHYRESFFSTIEEAKAELQFQRTLSRDGGVWLETDDGSCKSSRKVS